VADPAEAFAALEKKEIGLRTPTVKNLELVQQGGAPPSACSPSLAYGRCRPSARVFSRWTASPCRCCRAIPAGIDVRELVFALEFRAGRGGGGRRGKAAIEKRGSEPGLSSVMTAATVEGAWRS